MTIVTRFAPSPTGFLHLGSARLALFNWLYTRKTQGLFHLRIEDTDRERSTKAATEAIIEGLTWLGLHWDGDIVFQSQRQERHQEIAEQLVKTGQAYYCYLTPQEVHEFKESYPHQKLVSPWRNNTSLPSRNSKPTIRLRSKENETLTFSDNILGPLKMQAKELEDLVLMRSDSTPTYMLAVVVDDHDMGITDIIRGNDHVTNTFKQLQIYQAMQWEIPKYTHVPLICGPDGAKLSKRHGALGIDFYRDAGYLPNAMCNYLLLLGWGHATKEIISMEEAVNLFMLQNVGKASAKFDIKKLNAINAHYIQNANDDLLLKELIPILHIEGNIALQEKVTCGIPLIKPRAQTLAELGDLARIYVSAQAFDTKSIDILQQDGSYTLLTTLVHSCEKIADSSWDLSHLKNIEEMCAMDGYKRSTILQVLRASVLGIFKSPNILEVMEILGKCETISRMKSTLQKHYLKK